MFQRCMVLLIAASVTGCVSAPANKFGAISPSTRGALQGSQPIFIEAVPGKGLAYSTSADTAAMAAGVMFGAIGGAIGAGIAIKNANRRGAALVAADGILDPASAVAETLRTRLIEAGHPYSDNASLRFQVTTIGWGFNNSTLAYSAALQIGEPRGQFTKGECRYIRKLTELGVDSNALVANSGARLKAEYAKAAEYCSSYFSGVLISPKPTTGATSAARQP